MENNVFVAEELVNEILLRLAVKSLGRCKCVCKLWCSIINSTCFNFQHQNDTNNDNTSNLYLLIDTSSVANPLRKTIIHRLSHHTFEAVQTLYPDPLIDPKLGQIHIACTCNGLILFSYLRKTKWGLWNPTTGETKLLPPSSSSSQALMLKQTIPNCGFGFDTKTMDYKVVLIHKYDTGIVVVEIYSLKTNSWTTIATYSHKDFQTYKYPPAVFTNDINGMLSWIASYEEDGDIPYKIISLDLSNETIITTLLPSSISQRHLHTQYSKVKFNYPFLYKDSLALVNYPIFTKRRLENKSFEIWVLGEYGVKESWKKLFTIGPLPGIDRVLGFWEDGKVFVQTFHNPSFSQQLQKPIYVKKLLLLDTLNPTQRLQIFSGYYIKVFTYRESLVSLKS